MGTRGDRLVTTLVTSPKRPFNFLHRVVRVGGRRLNVVRHRRRDVPVTQNTLDALWCNPKRIPKTTLAKLRFMEYCL